MGKREDILNATIFLIAEEGIMSTTISNILKKASTGYGTLYNYFDSKEDLLLEVYISIINSINSYIFNNINTSIDSDLVFKFTINKYLDYCLEHHYEFTALETLRTIPDICSTVKDTETSNLQLFNVIKKCEDDGIISSRNEGYNIYLLLGMVATFVKYYRGNEINITDKIKNDLVESCIRALA